MRPRLVGDVDEPGAETFAAGLGHLGVDGIARGDARQVEPQHDAIADARRLDAADEDALLVEVSRGGLHGLPLGDEPDGKGHRFAHAFRLHHCAMSWMVYGASGYTGQLIAELAKARGQAPVLAGRSAGKVRPLAEKLGLSWRAFDLDKPDLRDVQLVLHCAGPFAPCDAPEARL